jgi:CRISPR-associated exonuclease Cas4
VTPSVTVVGILALAGVILLGVGGWALARWWSARWSGTLLAADDGRSVPHDLVAEEYALVGRPDEVWRLRDGRLVPVEIKSRTAPASGTFPSHRVQVEAYCLLVESTSGRPPPYGVVVYAGGVRRTVRWDPERRRALLGLLAELRRPYDGAATPSPGKCRGCRWRDGCDARAG